MIQSPVDPRVNLKDPRVAAVLAFLIPGLGHAYQGRWFKAAIFSIGLLSLFFYGMLLTNGHAVYIPDDDARTGRGWMLRFAAQSGIGSAGMFAVLQQMRYDSDDNQGTTSLESPELYHFDGVADLLNASGRQGKFSGTLDVEPYVGGFGHPSIRGELEGVFDDEPMTLPLVDVELGRPIEPRPGRLVAATIVDGHGEDPEPIGRIYGEVPRSWINRVSVPLDEAREQELHGQLGKFHELAQVCTWIAGLLNILVIWDAFEGPAYGYGDESEQEKPPTEQDDPDKQPAPQTEAAVHTATA